MILISSVTGVSVKFLPIDKPRNTREIWFSTSGKLLFSIALKTMDQSGEKRENDTMGIPSLMNNSVADRYWRHRQANRRPPRGWAYSVSPSPPKKSSFCYATTRTFDISAFHACFSWLQPFQFLRRSESLAFLSRRRRPWSYFEES